MTKSELVTVHHLARQAVSDLRQSTRPQVVTNQESLPRQYALRQRALQLGWRDEDRDVIEADWGLTAVAAEHRAGVNALVPQVTLRQVGIILALDVTRLARHRTDWDPLLDICGDTGGLIADRAGVDDPAPPHGRWWLGVKGTWSAMELPTSRARLPAGRRHQAARGDRALSWPMGLVREPFGKGHKTPDLEVQPRIELSVATLLRVRTASNVWQGFKAPPLTIPGRDRCGDLAWTTPTISALTAVRKHSASAGAFVDGKSRPVRQASAPGQTAQTPLPLDAWTIRGNDQDPASIPGETHVKIRAMRTANDAEYARHQTRGVPRAGAALRHGLRSGGECGHQLMVQDHGGPL